MQTFSIKRPLMLTLQLHTLVISFLVTKQWYSYKDDLNFYHFSLSQGTNARKVILEVYAFFVLQCTVVGRKSKHKTDVTA